VPPLASLNTGDTFSIEGWLKRGSTGGASNQVVASKQGSSWTLALNTANKLVLQANGLTITTSTAAITDTSAWHYVAATKTGSNVHVYVDGTDVTGTVSNVTLANSTSPLAIGQNANANWFNGKLDEVALYGTSLTSTQVAGHYALGAAPANAALPGVSGQTKDGEELSASQGTWTASPTTYSYQWRLCDSSGSACQNIVGATSQHYMPGHSEVGASVRVVVTAQNASGASTAATSAASGTVSASPPANTSLPAITGTTTESSTLTADAGAWSGTPASYSYQWQRCGADGGSCLDISGATTQSFALGAADVGHALRVRVTATNPAGSVDATSEPTSLVAGLAPSVTASPAVTGASTPPVQADQLTAHAATFGGTVISRSWQWQRCDDQGANCTDISGATSDFYQLDADDIGATVRVTETATNQTGSTPAYSATLGVVHSAAPVATTQPSIVGTPSQDARLVLVNANWSGGVGIDRYQWQRCDASGSRCADLPDATHWFYDITQVDVSHTIRVVETAENVFGSTRAVSDRTAVVTGTGATQAPANTAIPHVDGLAAQARTLTATTGDWSGDSLAYWYQWQQCAPDGGSCADIDGATADKYVLAAGDVGKTVRVVVTADNSLGSASAASAVTDVVSPPKAPVNGEPPEVSGGHESGDILAAATGSWDDSASSYSYQWRRCDASGANCADIPGATHVGYWVDTDDIDSTIRVRVTAQGLGASDATSSAAGDPIDGVPLPTTVQANLKSMTQAVVRNGAQETTATCDVVCDQVRKAVAEANTSPASAAHAIAEQAATVESYTGALPPSPTADPPTVETPTPRPRSVPTPKAPPPPAVPPEAEGLCLRSLRWRSRVKRPARSAGGSAPRRTQSISTSGSRPRRPRPTSGHGLSPAWPALGS
jgi:hypothetical protein